MLISIILNMKIYKSCKIEAGFRQGWKLSWRVQPNFKRWYSGSTDEKLKFSALLSLEELFFSLKRF